MDRETLFRYNRRNTHRNKKKPQQKVSSPASSSTQHNKAIKKVFLMKNFM